MNGVPNNQVQVFLEILHQPLDLGDGQMACMECPEQPWPCRTMSLVNIGVRMDNRGMGPLRVSSLD